MATEPRPRLSVAMLVEDAPAEVVVSSIESVRAVADEIVALCAGSAAPTPQVLADLGIGITVRHAAWDRDRSALRNRLLCDVAGRWVLWLEPGERLAPESAEVVASFVEDLAEPLSAARLWIEMPPGAPGEPTQQAARVRLMPNRADLRFEGRVRETVLPSIHAAGVPIALLPARILCDPWHHDAAWRAARADRDIELAMLEQGPGDSLPVRALLAMGDAAVALEDWPLARQSYGEAVRIAPPGSTEKLEAYYGLLVTFAGHSGEADEQLAVALEALEAFPLDAQLLLAMGGLLQGRQRLDLATRCFELAARCGQVDLETWHPCDLGQTAVVCLGAALALQGRLDEAARVLAESLAAHPDWMRVRRGLLELLVRGGQSVEALRVAERLAVDPRQREPLRNAIRGACRAARQEWAEALEFLQRAWQAGCRDPICLRGLVQARLAMGRTEGLESLLAQWGAAEPGSAEVEAYRQALVCGEHTAVVAPPGAAGLSQTWVRIDPAATPGPAAAHFPLVTETVCYSPPYPPGILAESVAAAGPWAWPGRPNSTVAGTGR